MKIQRIIHLVSALAQSLAVYIGWAYLPPYLAHNPGVELFVVIFVGTELSHVIWHGR